jgi:hypothetical protein
MELHTTNACAVGKEITRRTRHRSPHACASVRPLEVEQLVRAFLDAGGQVTVCPPGDAIAKPTNALQDRLRRAERLLGGEVTAEQRSTASGDI